VRGHAWLPLIAAVALLAACSGDDDDAPPICSAPAEAGPYAAGTRDLTLDDPLREAPFQARVAYPAIAAGSATQPDGSGAPYPLVVFSHGLLMYPETYDYLFTHLASHGFVVLGTKHRDSAEFVVDIVKNACATIPEEEQIGKTIEVVGSLFEEDHPLRRPADMSHLIDIAAALDRSDPILTGMIDLGRVGAVGHSFGAFTSLMLAGAEVDRANITDLCSGGPWQWLADMSDEDPVKALKALMCFLFDSVSEESMARPFDVQDERISAVTSIAGPVEWIWGEQYAGLDQVELPVLMVYTSTDASVQYEQAVVPAYSAFNAPKYFLTVDGGTHGNFGDTDMAYFDALAAEVPDSCHYKEIVGGLVSTTEVPALEPADQTRLTRVPVAAFLQHHLAGATGCGPYLVPGYYENEDAEVQEFQALAE